MATVSVERQIDVDPEQAWRALADWGGLHERLVPGFAVDVRLDGDGRDRLVTFFNGVTVRERLVSLDVDARRLVWSIVDGPYGHHNGAAQTLPHPGGGTRFAWTADILPDELAEQPRQMMERGVETAKTTLERG